MIDTHLHVVRPRLPGVGALDPLLDQGPDIVADALRREMLAAGVTDVRLHRVMASGGRGAVGEFGAGR